MIDFDYTRIGSRAFMSDSLGPELREHLARQADAMGVDYIDLVADCYAERQRNRELNEVRE